ncbi:hypothetical protein B566_EDAN009266 [Ephemera danica]|nr:hypothetical protein B566_EDAN009266 [Ephemera danica]
MVPVWKGKDTCKKMADNPSTSSTNPATAMSNMMPSAVPTAGPKGEKIDAKTPADKNTLLAILQVLRKCNFKGTEEFLKKEANLTDLASLEVDSAQADSEVSSVLSAYKSEGDPDAYEGAYTDLKKFVEGSLDIYKHELGTILYPIFVHMYLELVYNDHEAKAIAFMQKFGPEQEDYYQDDLRRLAHVTKRDHLKDNELTDTFKSSEFIIRMSRDTLSILKRHLKEKKRSVVPNIVQEHLYFDMYEGVARNKQQIDATAGAVVGEATRQDNKARVYYGLLKEPDLQFVPAEEEEEPDVAEGDKPKKKKPKKDPLFSKKTKSDPNAPTVDRMPLPELVTCAEYAEDSSLLAVGFADSAIKVWSLVPQKLRAMKSAEQLSDIDKDAEDVLVRMMDDRSAETSRMLHGHQVRLWSLQTWTCLVSYKGHNFPVWSVKFAPHGYYFASASHDRTARLWATDQHQPLRIFAGHFSDVDVVQFHPNSNYIASASSDRTVRLWDCVTGSHVRLMTGHKSPIYSLCFSVEGRFLASAGADCQILVWDLAHGHLLAELAGHTAPIHALAFSRCGSILTSVKLWDFARLAKEVTLEDVNVSHNPDIKRGENQGGYMLRSYATKNSPLQTLHYTRRNVLLAVGVYEAAS